MKVSGHGPPPNGYVLRRKVRSPGHVALGRFTSIVVHRDSVQRGVHPDIVLLWLPIGPARPGDGRRAGGRRRVRAQSAELLDSGWCRPASAANGWSSLARPVVSASPRPDNWLSLALSSPLWPAARSAPWPRSPRSKPPPTTRRLTCLSPTSRRRPPCAASPTRSWSGMHASTYWSTTPARFTRHAS